jgi:hypothetical protein
MPSTRFEPAIPSIEHPQTTLDHTATGIGYGVGWNFWNSYTLLPDYTALFHKTAFFMYRNGAATFYLPIILFRPEV